MQDNQDANARIEWNWNWAALGVALLGVLAVLLASPVGYEGAINRFLVRQGFSSTHLGELQYAHAAIAAPFALVGLIFFGIGILPGGKKK